MSSTELREMIDFLYSGKQFRLKGNSKPWSDSETTLAIRRRHKLFKKYKKTDLEIEESHFRSVIMALQKALSKKRKTYFPDKTENECKEL